MIRFYVRFLCLVTSLLSGQQVAAETNKHTLQLVGNKFSEALKYADANMWDEASKKVDALNSSVSFELLQWLKLRAGTKEFSEYEAFLLINSDWPGMDLLRSQGERVISPSVQSARLYNYFSNSNPLTANGSLSFAEVLLSDQEIKRAQGVMKESWLKHSYSANELERANKLFGSFLEQLNEQRIDNLLWSGRTEQAEMMLSLVPTDIRFLSEARIALKRQNVGVDALISKVPKHLKANPGLLFDRFSYRKRENLHKGAEQILLYQFNDAEALGKADFWVKGRSFYARRALLSGEPIKAYKIASNHFIDFSEPHVQKEAIELEWLAGFIAFEFLREYKIALKHFQRFAQFVVNPINQAKASYWIGRSYERLSENKKMMVSYSRGAKYQTTFYGQLSAERGGFPVDSTFSSKFSRHEWKSADFMKDATVKSAILLYYSGRSVLADRFFNHASENMKQSERLKLSQLANDLGLKASGLSIAKTAGQMGIFCPDFLFPNIEERLLIDPELASLTIAIIRQESGFFTYTKSTAGALGLMQVMPRTAASMAKKLNLSFSKEKLLNDKSYNIKIGTYFLKTLLKKFDGSKVLSLAAYNAGPNRTKEWINKFGDPRVKGIDPLVWIELIPYLETRNYVKRVMEAEWVYQGKLNGQPAQLNLGRQSFGHIFQITR